MSLAQKLKETADRWHSEKVEIPKELLMELKKAADIPDPWRYWRLSQKYFQSVVSRARGIKLEV